MAISFFQNFEILTPKFQKQNIIGGSGYKSNF